MPQPIRLETTVLGDDEFYSESLPHPEELGNGVTYVTEPIHPSNDPDPAEMLSAPTKGEGFVLLVPPAEEEKVRARLAEWAAACHHEIEIHVG